MGELLKEFEQQFGCVTAEITSLTCKLLTGDIVEGRLQLEYNAKILVGDAYELLERMEMEVREVSQDQRERLKNRVLCYKTELKRLEEELNKAINEKLCNAAEDRRELLEHAETANSFSVSQEQTQKLLESTETLERATFRLDQSYKVSLETEEVGAMVLNDLHHQRETISSARNRLHETDEDLEQSSRVLNVMLRRFLQNKFIMITTISVVVFVLFISIATKFLH